MTTFTEHTSYWQGRALLLPGLGIFIGRSGDNREHKHWAHQISVSIDEPLQIQSNGVTHWYNAAFIRAGISHQVASQPMLSVYLDPTTRLAQGIIDQLQDTQAIVVLSDELGTFIRRCFLSGAPLETGVRALQATVQVRTDDVADPRLERVLTILHESMATQKPVSCAELAKVAGLSTSRFSHWFKEATGGLPLRSYRKWLRLISGVELALKGTRLAHAAHAVEFADQAHFTRTFVEMFGVTPSDALTYLTTENHLDPP